MQLKVSHNPVFFVACKKLLWVFSNFFPLGFYYLCQNFGFPKSFFPYLGAMKVCVPVTLQVNFV